MSAPIAMTTTTNPANFQFLAFQFTGSSSSSILLFRRAAEAALQILGHWSFFELVLSSALRRAFASFTASSFAQKCM
jgi:hypothetical protein